MSLIHFRRRPSGPRNRCRLGRAGAWVWQGRKSTVKPGCRVGRAQARQRQATTAIGRTDRRARESPKQQNPVNQGPARGPGSPGRRRRNPAHHRQNSGDAERSLQQIAETTARLFDGQSVRIRIAENGEWVRTIAVGASAERVGAEVSPAQGRIGGNNLPSTVVLENRQIHIPDLDHLDPAIADWPGLPHARAAGARTMAGIPLRRDGRAIGVLIDLPLPARAVHDGRACVAAKLRGPGRHRHRERAAVQRDQGGAGPADRDLRDFARHQRVADRRTAGIRRHRAHRRAAVALRPVIHPALRQRRLLDRGIGGAARPGSDHTVSEGADRPRRQLPLTRDRGEKNPAPGRLVGDRIARIRASHPQRFMAPTRRCTCRCCAGENASACSPLLENKPTCSARAKSRWPNPSATRP